MLIKKVVYKENDIFGDSTIKFTDRNGKEYKKIVIAGENGCGKTSLLSDIYCFLNGERKPDFCEIELIDDESRNMLFENSGHRLRSGGTFLE